MSDRPLTVAWFSYFPVEWLPDLPEPLQKLPRQHPASWQRVLLAEFEKVSSLRLHVIVLRKQFERNFTFQRNGVEFHLVRTPGGLRAPTLFWVDTLLIGRVLRKVRPDVVHAWGTEQGATLAANRLGYPRVATIQGLFTWYGELIPLNWHERLAAWMERHSLPRVPVVTTECRFAVQYLRDKFPGLHVEQIEHAPDPLFHHVERRPQTKPIRFIFVGAFGHRKGGDLLLRALDQVKGEIAFELIAVGKPQPAFQQALQAKVSSELWRRIVFKEHLTYQEVAQELTTATIMICPTRADVSPNAVKEAVVAGVPVIGSNVGGIPDYVFPGRNGFLFPSGDLQALIWAVRAACMHPLFRLGLVETEALRRVRDYLSPRLMARRFLSAYDLAVNSQRR